MGGGWAEEVLAWGVASAGELERKGWGRPYMSAVVVRVVGSSEDSREVEIRKPREGLGFRIFEGSNKTVSVSITSESAVRMGRLGVGGGECKHSKRDSDGQEGSRELPARSSEGRSQSASQPPLSGGSFSPSHAWDQGPDSSHIFTRATSLRNTVTDSPIALDTQNLCKLRLHQDLKPPPSSPPSSSPSSPHPNHQAPTIQWS